MVMPLKGAHESIQRFLPMASPWCRQERDAHPESSESRYRTQPHPRVGPRRTGRTESQGPQPLTDEHPQYFLHCERTAPGQKNHAKYLPKNFPKILEVLSSHWTGRMVCVGDRFRGFHVRYQGHSRLNESLDEWSVHSQQQTLLRFSFRLGKYLAGTWSVEQYGSC